MTAQPAKKYECEEISGGGPQESDEFGHLLTDETRQKKNEVLWLTVRDVVKGAFDETIFDSQVKLLEAAAQDRMERPVEDVIEITAKHFGIAEGERKSVLQHLIEGGDLSRYGLHSAITRASQDVANYDRATELEKVGGRVIELAPSEWKKLAGETAAASAV